MSALAVLVAGTAFAHGDHDTGKPQGAEEKRPWWLDLVPRAAAAQQMEIDERQGARFVRADGLPNHATGAFPNRTNPNRISAQSYYFRMPLRPVKTGRATYYRPNHLFGVAVNGVVFDPNTAEFWNDDRRSGWMIEALSGSRPLGIDQNNAHVQPDGSYHYHGVPTGLVDKLGGKGRVLVGWAADGFAIHVDETVRSSWRLKTQRDPGGPGRRPDGTYSLDYEYVRGIGDLDECNGREEQGAYHYVVTAKFPHVPRCFMGTADASFVKQGGPPPGRPPPRR
jgi:YHYH protein